MLQSMGEIEIVEHRGPLLDLRPFFELSTSIENPAGIDRLVAIEVARKTRYFVARERDLVVGFVGIFLDEDHEIGELEPPQLIDIAVSPEHRKKGIARKLVAKCSELVSNAGFDRIWLYTDAQSAAHHQVYLQLGFQLVSIIPEWSKGYSKAYYRLDVN
jgi:ribosomal protein S18 acetylase RimI-like enzyme